MPDATDLAAPGTALVDYRISDTAN